MSRIYTVGDKTVDLDDVAAVRALTPAEFAELLKLTYTQPDPDPDAGTPEIPVKQPPAGTGFVIITPPASQG